MRLLPPTDTRARAAISAAILLMMIPAAGRASDAGMDAAASSIEDGVARFHRAYHAWDREGMATALERFEQAGREGYDDPTLLLYWKSVARVHLALHRLGDESRAAAGLADDLAAARDTLEELMAHAPEHGEGHALLSTLYGVWIAVERFRAVSYGRRFQRHLRAALEAEPDNPRVHYLAGTGLLQAPRILGSPRTAMEHLRTAERLFEQEHLAARPPPAPAWGHASCLVFLGTLHEQQSQPEQARQAFRKALDLNPAEGRAAEGLARLQTASES